MIRLYIIVEGQSEEAFVNELLVPFLCDYGILALACLVGKPGHKGGLITYNKAKFDILKLLKQDQRAYCTTMFDYYALPTSFPGMPITARTTTEKAALVEAALLNDIASTLGDGFDPKRFLPYIQMHEYEGILFSDPELLAEDRKSVV